MTIELTIDPHPLLSCAAIVSDFSKPLGELEVPAWLRALHALEADTPVRRDESTRETVRALLRHGGYKPTGRGKPSSEYLVRAVGEGALGSINLAVDVCNAVSLASGLPISVVDLAQATGPFRIGLAEADTRYVFNPSGQTIDVSGLLCLFDREGPCANAVKDSTTHQDLTGDDPNTVHSVGPQDLGAHVQRTAGWYRELLERAEAGTEAIPIP